MYKERRGIGQVIAGEGARRKSQPVVKRSIRFLQSMFGRSWLISWPRPGFGPPDRRHEDSM